MSDFIASFVPETSRYNSSSLTLFDSPIVLNALMSTVTELSFKSIPLKIKYIKFVLIFKITYSFDRVRYT